MTLKTKIAGLAMIVLGSVLSAPLVSLAADAVATASDTPVAENNTTPSESPRPVNATQRQQMLAEINRSITSIDSSINQVQTDPNIGARTKQVALTTLNDIRTQLISHRNRVTAATTNNDLTASNLQYLSYIASKASVIADIINAVLLDLAEQFSQRVHSLQATLTPLLPTLRAICPNQQADIDGVANQLAQVSAALTRLDAAIAQKNVSAVGTEVNTILQLGTTISNNLQSIRAACGV